MTVIETRRYAMLTRVRTFGEAHRDLFPDGSEGGEAFAAVATAVANLGTYGRSKLSSTRDGRQAKIAAREALRERLETIARTARAIAEKTPGFDDPFHLPRKLDDETLLLACPMFLDEAEAKKDRFVRHGLSETFVADLKALVDQFAQAVRAVLAAKERSRVARKGIAAADLAGLAAVRQLDVIVANQLERDPDALAHWAEARKIEYTGRRRSAALTAAVAAAAPVAPSAPAPVPAAAPPSAAVTSQPPSSSEAEAGQPPLAKAS